MQNCLKITLLLLCSSFAFAQTQSDPIQTGKNILQNAEITIPKEPSQAEYEFITENEEIYYQKLMEYYQIANSNWMKLNDKGYTNFKKPLLPSSEELTSPDAAILRKYYKQAKESANAIAKIQGNKLIDVLKNYDVELSKLRNENERLQSEIFMAQLDTNYTYRLRDLVNELYLENDSLREAKMMSDIANLKKNRKKIEEIEKYYSSNYSKHTNVMSFDFGGNQYFSNNSALEYEPNFRFGINLNTNALIGIENDNFEIYGEYNNFNSNLSNQNTTGSLIFNSQLYAFGLSGTIKDIMNLGSYSGYLKVGVGFFFSDTKSPNQINFNSDYARSSNKGQQLRLELGFRNTVRNHPVDLFIGYSLLFYNNSVVYSAPETLNIGKINQSSLNFGLRFGLWKQYGE